MGEDLELGDMGTFDAMGLQLDVPTPSIEDPAGVSADFLGPGGVAATVADLGLSPSVPSIHTEDGHAAGFQGSLALPEGEAGGIGGLPLLDPPAPPEAPPAFSAEGPAPAMEFGAAEPGVAAFAGPVSIDDGIPGGLPGLPGLEPPPAAQAAFSPVGAAVDEVLDFQMSMLPPEPSREGISSASDAPMAPPAPKPSVDSLPGSPGLSLAMAESISFQVWGGGGAPAGTPSARGATAAGPAIHIQNLHLPAVSSNEMLDQLLAQAPDLTNLDLSQVS